MHFMNFFLQAVITPLLFSSQNKNHWVSTVSKAKRSITFNDFTPYRRISDKSGYVINEIPTRNRRECAIQCLKNPECKSYSFCQIFCYLYSIGLTELYRSENLNILTSSDENCVHFSMEKDFIPQCQERGLLRSIQDEQNPNYCKINKKRTDGLLVDREYFNTTINTTTEYKGFSKRHCLVETALNGGFCKAGYEINQVWVVWSEEPGNHSQCSEFCQNIGGMLYPDLEGDTKQLEFLSQLKTLKVWLGITTNGKWYEWENMRGEKMTPDRMRWNKFKYRWASTAAVLRQRDAALLMREPWTRARGVCQMIV